MGGACAEQSKPSGCQLAGTNSRGTVVQAACPWIDEQSINSLNRNGLTALRVMNKRSASASRLRSTLLEQSRFLDLYHNSRKNSLRFLNATQASET